MPKPNEPLDGMATIMPGRAAWGVREAREKRRSG